MRQVDSFTSQLDLLLHSLGRSPEELPRETEVGFHFPMFTLYTFHRTPSNLYVSRSSVKNGIPCDDRSSLFANDPHVRKFDTERVQCKNCEQWITLGSSDNAVAVQKWKDHRNTCLHGVSSSSTTPAASTSNVR